MAEFCNQCARELGFPEGELAGLGQGQVLPLDHGWSAICEGCGFIVVDDDGNCIAKDCLKNHNPTEEEHDRG